MSARVGKYPWRRALTALALLFLSVMVGWRLGVAGVSALKAPGEDILSRQVEASEIRASPPQTLSLPGVAGPPRKVSEPEREARWERERDEWQGMLPMRQSWSCSEGIPCGMARACVNGRCVPCEKDQECPFAEICALGHCVHQELAECSRAHDCEEGALCVLSGYTALDLHGNRDLRSACLKPSGRSPFPESKLEDSRRGFPHLPVAPTAADRVMPTLRELLSAADAGVSP